MLKDYTKENVARLRAKPVQELTHKERVILQNVDMSKLVARLKEQRGIY